jgi:hypothetical protein
MTLDGCRTQKLSVPDYSGDNGSGGFTKEGGGNNNSDPGLAASLKTPEEAEAAADSQKTLEAPRVDQLWRQHTSRQGLGLKIAFMF